MATHSPYPSDGTPHPLAGAPTGPVLGARDALHERGVQFGSLAHRTKLDEHLPQDHALSTVYRAGAGVAGLGLLVFGVLGLFNRVWFFSREGDTTMGLNTNGALSTLSIAVGLLLLYGAYRGGNFASTLNMVLGAAFLLSGFANLAVMETSWNILAFRMPNVIFSFIVGLLLLTFGMYGRVSGGLPHDNPYWRTRNPERALAEDREHTRAA
ncbi:DUF4383 domain-containing protein [Streptomyces sp. A7024]|uniref:DUF4383 domain-containing protein n=1 Tax=Streptomyces coryli TaxID=1128680 RepID=A0A6G4UEC5_9ACTN|nr:DUF4383 domain-containing protein [Streptomyces coryli]NGN69828.1 DUF4383 domain-containing protein [Streptomyces coryli]